jgi:hypothetical protein
MSLNFNVNSSFSNLSLTQCVNFIDSSRFFLQPTVLPGDQKGLFKLAVQLRNFFNSVIYNTATGYVLLVYLTNI